MADEMRIALLDLLRKHGVDEGADLLREGMRILAQTLMELEVGQHVGAEGYERRNVMGNGYRDRQWDTRVGTVDLKVP